MELSIPVPVPELPNVIPAHPWTDIIILLSDKWKRYGKMFCPVAVFNILVDIFWVIFVAVFRVTTVVTMLINLMDLGN